MTGEELLTHIKEADGGTAVIVASAKDDVRTRVALLRAGADDYVVKPFDTEELLARLEAGEMDFQMERVNITNLFQETISMFYDDFAHRDCEPTVEIPQTPCYVIADRNALARIMENLIKMRLSTERATICFH